jgi:hypothetical protein
VNTGQVRDLIVNQVQLGRLERDDDFTTALLLTLIGIGCKGEESVSDGPKVPA